MYKCLCIVCICMYCIPLALQALDASASIPAWATVHTHSLRKLAHAVMDAESRLRRTDGLGPIQVWRPWEEAELMVLIQVQVWVWRQENNVPDQDRLREKICSYSAFYSVQAFNGLDEAHLHWGGQSALLGLQSRMFISHGDILTDTQK